MFDLTPGERRGAWVLLVLCVLGTLWERTQAGGAAAPPVAGPSATTLASAATAGEEAGDSARAAPEASGRSGGAPAPAAGRRRKAPPSAPVDVATADAARLGSLPGIGPVLAARIVAYRAAHGPFRSPDELLAVPGIGPRLYDRLRPFVTVGRARPGGLQDATGSRR